MLVKKANSDYEGDKKGFGHLLQEEKGKNKKIVAFKNSAGASRKVRGTYDSL